jgi:DNA-directed RNA polymerase specialized sigma24 family protein
VVVITSQGGRVLEPGELWRCHAAELVRYASVLVGPTDAHDVVVEAFLRATSSAQFPTVVNPRAWLYRATTNEAHNHRRQARRRWARDLAAVGALTTLPPDPLIDVRRAMAELSVRQRAVIFLIYWADMTETATAELLGISPGTVRRHLVRARVHLRKALS